jgi:hypothetical protein
MASTRVFFPCLPLNGAVGWKRNDHHHFTVYEGLGRQLADRCLQVLKESGIQKCHIFIFNDNANGIAFWKSAGWALRTDIGVISKIIRPAA